ncbi:unnamed protein product, partial [Amoebophrya sp. A25]
EWKLECPRDARIRYGGQLSSHAQVPEGEVAPLALQDGAVDPDSINNRDVSGATGGTQLTSAMTKRVRLIPADDDEDQYDEGEPLRQKMLFESPLREAGIAAKETAKKEALAAQIRAREARIAAMQRQYITASEASQQHDTSASASGGQDPLSGGAQARNVEVSGEAEESTVVDLNIEIRKEAEKARKLSNKASASKQGSCARSSASARQATSTRKGRGAATAPLASRRPTWRHA